MKLLTLTLVLLTSASVYALSPDEIVKRADEGRMPSGDVTFIAVVKDFDQKTVTHETKYRVSSKGPAATLVETIAPERQKGRRLLMEGNNLWFYTPDTKRPARVSMQQKLTGEVANGDLARTNFSGDYEAELKGEETVNGQRAYKLALKAKHDDVTYSKIDYWVAVKGFLPLKAVFYAVSGKPLKTGAFSKPKKIAGQNRMTEITMQDAMNKKKSSVMVYSGHKRGKLPDSLFNKDGFDE